MIQTMDTLGDEAWPSPYPPFQCEPLQITLTSADRPPHRPSAPSPPRAQAARSRSGGMAADAAMEGGDA
jgi:hypothetical protein